MERLEIEVATLQNTIFEIRGQRVMLDYDLAALYEVETKALNQAVKRNVRRFPSDFMFRLSVEEWEVMRSQFVTTYPNQSKRNIQITPFAFTEQGVALLAGVLRSDKAIDVNISIMRAFVAVRKHLTDHKDLQHKIEALEASTDQRFKDVYEALDYMINTNSARTLIGFGRGEEGVL